VSGSKTDGLRKFKNSGFQIKYICEVRDVPFFVNVSEADAGSSAKKSKTF